ncbi:EpsG family protein [Alloalcanivorax gelatiniphagus]|uniref:EpsG family protein n=1 Tax=Alloalcanivorax gelatiniphagus TaxID=1194167 RepID=A0ABY2XPP7_9GAMM|nr:EpsG family protein [Alloalcanivorax gelatiniphagus]TMW13625.1 EpsG family protein [Alloalcanivorax gelatiniphagus]
MLPYWFFFLIPASVVLVNQPANSRTRLVGWGAVWLFFTLAIGLRHQVGGDWWAYLRMFENQVERSFADVISGNDPGYLLLCWLAQRYGGTIYFVNTVCGMILMTGVVRFSRTLPLPWLALLVSVPYLIIVVGMGYTRQAAALGFLMLGLVSLANRSMRQFVFWTLLGATFHKSAVLMLPVAALASTTQRFWSLFWGGVVSLAAAYLFVFDSVEHLWASYVEADYQSQGGLIRVLMNAVPAVLFLVFSRSMSISDAERKLWSWMALLSLACIPLVIISSTATDRVALYLIPIQLFVFSHLPSIAKDPRIRGVIVLAVMAYYGVVQFVWLVFGAHSYAWDPYRFLIFN